MTVLHVGPEKDATDAEVEEMVAGVRQLVAREDVGPLELTLGRPTVGTYAIECAARPGPRRDP